MFLIPTYLKPSSIHGVGVFTSIAIPANTIIWKFHPDVDWKVSPEEMAQFPEPYQSKIRMYAYEEEDGTLVVCGDNAKFMNHSFEPNCIDPDGVHTITQQDIEADTELTCDYRMFDLESARLGDDLFGGTPETNNEDT